MNKIVSIALVSIAAMLAFAAGPIKTAQNATSVIITPTPVVHGNQPIASIRFVIQPNDAAPIINAMLAAVGNSATNLPAGAVIQNMQIIRMTNGTFIGSCRLVMP